MKSLKPIEEETSLTLIASDVKDELDSKISTLKNTVNSLENDVEDLSAEVNKRNIDKETVNASRVNATTINADNGYIGEQTAGTITADRITATESVNTHLLRADEISADDTTTHILHTDSADISGKVTVGEIETDKITATDVDATNVTSSDTISDTLTATNASISNATISNLNSPTRFEAQTLASTNLETTNAEIENLTAELSEELKARIKTLFNQTRQFADDLTDADQFIILGEPNSGSDGANDPRYIKVPHITSGWYRLELREDTSEARKSLFSIIYSNAETTPIIHYSKQHSGDLTHFYYDAEKDELWIETYASGYIYWASDARDAEYAPQTYTELSLDITLPTTYSFNTTRKHQWVLMGNHTAEYALTVQGLIEADIIKSNGDLKLAHFYGNDSLELLRFVQGYFAHKNEDEELEDFQQAETIGYVYHTDSVEPVEKMMYFGNDPVYTDGEKFVQETRWVADRELTGYCAEIEGDVLDILPQLEFRNNNYYLKTVDSTPFLPSTKTFYKAEDGVRKELPIVYSPILSETVTDDGLSVDVLGYYYIDGLSAKNIVGRGWTYYHDQYYLDVTDPVTLGRDTINIDIGDSFNYTQDARNESILTKVLTETEVDAHEDVTSPYRDHDQTKTEALEKVRLINDTKIVLTVDSDYGQDDITIDYTDGEYGTLPFVLGFTFRSKESDYLLNLDNFVGDPSVLES